MLIEDDVWVTVRYRLFDSQGDALEPSERELTYLQGGYGAVFPRIEERIDRIRESRSYKIVVAAGGTKNVVKIQQVLEECSLHILEHHQSKSGESIIGTWRVIGAPASHEKFVEHMLRDKSIKEMDY